ncbi:MAG TPA: prolyl oligopeptidase family serine peptidase [Bryobacteraceae bacterium]|nr:prolyl oligopeptidase family serine peptidase [Bryobacteraceae bacterium]
MKSLLLRLGVCAAIGLLTDGRATGQSDAEQLTPILAQPIQTPDVTAYQLRQYLMGRMAPLPSAAGAAEWTAEAKRIRRHLLEDVVFHGWPAEWVNAPPKFEEAGEIEGNGYRIRKFRYEIVPGFQSTALLYEPDHLAGKIPAILNVNGHVGPLGKAIEYKQKRCINYAKHGILALSLEWLAFGELMAPENDHAFAAHLDLVGMNGVGLFYLAMRRGLDYLYEHPNTDRSRLGVTGLSGGGWQTITLSSLDERVVAAVPVAGFAGPVTAIEHPEYIGNDIEQNPTDFRDGQDYTHLAAMRAPRPTLLIYNAEDDCCFRAPLVKPYVYDDVRRFFKLYGKEDAFDFHENRDPGTHNYQLDNREQSYRFFTKVFHMAPLEHEIPVDREIHSYEELSAGLPRNNLTILGLARERARAIRREPLGPPAAERKKLATLVRYKPVTVKHAWAVTNTKNKGVETLSFQFQLSNDLAAAGVLLKAISTPAVSPVTIVLNDKGRKSASNEVSDRVNRGEQVLALDLLFRGDVAPKDPGAAEYAQMLSAMGDRPLGMQAAQLIGIAHWLGERAGAKQVRIESTGARGQITALMAAALEPAQFSGVEIHEGIDSLAKLLDGPVTYEAAPDLFCLDLYKEFDLDRLAALAKAK